MEIYLIREKQVLFLTKDNKYVNRLTIAPMFTSVIQESDQPHCHCHYCTVVDKNESPSVGIS